MAALGLTSAAALNALHRPVPAVESRLTGPHPTFMALAPIADVFAQLEGAQRNLLSVLSTFQAACTQLYKTAAQIPYDDKSYVLLDENLIRVSQQLDSISETEHTLAQSLALLRRARNISKTIVPINRLPEELLASVFQFVVASQDGAGVDGESSLPHPLTTIPSVSTSWRRLALCTPRLWARIEFFGKDQLTTLSRVTLWSQRAREAPLHLHLGQHRLLEDRGVAPELKSIPNRAESLNFPSFADETYVQDFFNQYDASRASSKLKAITIACSQWPSPLYSHFNWSRVVPDTLTVIKLVNTTENITPTMDELLSLLSRTPNLRTLILRDVSVAPDPCTIREEIHLPHLEYLESYPHRHTRPSYVGVTKHLVQSIVPGTNDIEAWLEMGVLDDEEHDSAMRKFFARSRVTRLHTGYFRPEDHLLLAQYLDCLPELCLLSLDFDCELTNDVLGALLMPGQDLEQHARCPKLQALRISEARITPTSQNQLKQIVEVYGLSRLIFGDRAYFVDDEGSPNDESEIMEWLHERVSLVETDGLQWFGLAA